MQIPEHTWGTDIKESLPDWTNWDNKAFHALLADNADIYVRSIDAWDRQYDYLRWAVDAYSAEPQASPACRKATCIKPACDRLCCP